jgi:hypothetical protein
MSKHPMPWKIKSTRGDFTEVVDANGCTICDNEQYYPTAVSYALQARIVALTEVAVAAAGMRDFFKADYRQDFDDKFNKALDKMEAALASLEALP